METTTQMITPVVAAEMLAANMANNRALSSLRVEMYASEMREGRWQETHQGIAFNDDGELVDGQHRLAAIIKSGVAIPMLVSRGVGALGRFVVDVPLKRSAGHVLKMEGIPNGPKVASIVRLALIYTGPQRNFTWTSMAGFRSNIEIVAAVRGRYSHAPEVNRRVARVYETSKVSRSGMGVVALLGWDHPQMEAFLGAVEMGNGTSKTDPCNRLRLLALQTPRGTNRPVQYWVAVCVKAWNFYLAGRETSQLTWRANESMPAMDLASLSG